MSPDKRVTLYNGIVCLLAGEGRLTDHTYEVIEAVLDSIDVEIP